MDFTFIDLRFIKNKKTSKWKEHICLFAKKSLYNRNIGPTKPVKVLPVKVLYEQKLVY